MTDSYAVSVYKKIKGISLPRSGQGWSIGERKIDEEHRELNDVAQE
jgi:hypothetical protein